MSTGKSIDFLLNQMRSSANGSLSSCWVFFYSAGTTNAKAIYLDNGMIVAAANPYQLSADGTAELFGDGLYRIVVKTNLNNVPGVTIYDYDNVEFYSSASIVALFQIPTITIANTTSPPGDKGVVLAVVTDQTIIMVGAQGYKTTISLPGGYTFASGETTYELTLDQESMQFKLVGTQFFRV